MSGWKKQMLGTASGGGEAMFAVAADPDNSSYRPSGASSTGTDSDGNVYFTVPITDPSLTNPSTDNRWVVGLAKYDVTGTFQFFKRISIQYGMFGHTIFPNCDDAVYIMARQFDGNFIKRILFKLSNADGSLTWRADGANDSFGGTIGIYVTSGGDIYTANGEDAERTNSSGTVQARKTFFQSNCETPTFRTNGDIHVYGSHILYICESNFNTSTPNQNSLMIAKHNTSFGGSKLFEKFVYSTSITNQPLNVVGGDMKESDGSFVGAVSRGSWSTSLGLFAGVYNSSGTLQKSYHLYQASGSSQTFQTNAGGGCVAYDQDTDDIYLLWMATNQTSSYSGTYIAKISSAGSLEYVLQIRNTNGTSYSNNTAYPPHMSLTEEGICFTNMFASGSSSTISDDEKPTMIKLPKDGSFTGNIFGSNTNYIQVLDVTSDVTMASATGSTYVSGWGEATGSNRNWNATPSAQTALTVSIGNFTTNGITTDTFA